MNYYSLIIALTVSFVAQADPGGRGCYGGRYSYGCGSGGSRGSHLPQRQGPSDGYENRDRDRESVPGLDQAVQLLANAYQQTKNPRFHEEAVLLKRSKKIFDVSHQTPTCRERGISAFADPDHQSITFCSRGTPPMFGLLHEGAHLTRVNSRMRFHSPVAEFPGGGIYMPWVECDAEAMAHETLTLNNMNAPHMPIYQALHCPDTLAEFPIWVQRYRSGQIATYPDGNSRGSRR